MRPRSKDKEYELDIPEDLTYPLFIKNVYAKSSKKDVAITYKSGKGLRINGEGVLIKYLTGVKLINSIEIIINGYIKIVRKSKDRLNTSVANS